MDDFIHIRGPGKLNSRKATQPVDVLAQHDPNDYKNTNNNMFHPLYFTSVAEAGLVDDSEVAQHLLYGLFRPWPVTLHVRSTELHIYNHFQ